MNKNEFWAKILGIGVILMIASFCISILMMPITLRGGIYTRLSEIQKQHLRSLEIQNQAQTEYLEKIFYEEWSRHVHERHMNDKAIFPKEIIDEKGETTIYY